MTGEVDKSAKEVKEEKEPKTPGSQEPSPAAFGSVPADWSGFQAYSPVPPHGFLTSSPQGHPYMWGVQQFIPPYGTPQHPYVAMYPHGGMYAHPTMTPGSYPFNPFAMPSPNGIVEASGNPHGNVEVDGKSEEKEKLPIKRSKESLGSLNVITGKKNGTGNTLGAPGNGVYSKSAESVSEDSSEGTDTNSHHESPRNSGGQQDSAEPSQNCGASHSSQNGGTKPPNLMVNQSTVFPGPTTNLNIGMDCWGGTPLSAVPPVQGGMVPTGSQDGVQPQLWRQDERELKRQKRKQSNRESARRSRLRKQAECDELAQRAEVLREENASLRAEMAHIRSEYEHLLAQNASLKERLGDDPSCSQDDQHQGNNAK